MTPGRATVVVTGLGVVSPAGNTVDQAFRTVLAAESTARIVPELVDNGIAVQFGCPVAPLDLDAHFSVRQAAQLDRPTQLAMIAALDAARDAGLASPDAAAPTDRAGVYVGSGAGGLSTTEYAAHAHRGAPLTIPVAMVPRVMPSSPAARIALRLGWQGPCLTFATACASGATALGEAALRIRAGDLDVAVAGGVDSAMSPMIMGAFDRIRALSTRNDDPAAASRPFDVDRDGFVMGEGAAFMVLERRDRALARGARIYGELAGYATNTDAYHIVAPHPEGELAARCMRRAISDAGLSPAEVGHINAHGTSTVLNDRAESRAIAKVFGERIPPVTAPKGVVGHLIGAAGAFEALIALCSARAGQIPPVANFGASAEADDIDVVAKVPRIVEPAPVLSNSFGFGGHNACLVLKPTA